VTERVARVIARMIAVVIAVVIAVPAQAQTVQGEARFEATGPDPYVYQPAVALGLRAGRYVRASVGSTLGERQRVDVLGRFTFDPFHERRFALSVGGGVSILRDRTYLAIVADVEGPAIGRVVPLVQVGLGGGPRFAVGVRQRIRGRR
jgi:hypothetical protein